ncbi:actin-like protein 10 [Penicillium brevicompactum]|uniref:actin-like protein 10 n=1 Tax=Penicillium brevicompactum TaxID=5074 RepID=UPI0025413166|nr:actin-like protein 10 [Penicillium brevicompactum]KAJ5337150.1 actin-like protein 10 [Penicillium brevicompactum]
MGPLMNKKHPDCLKSKKTPHEWSRYVHGASAVFAWHIAQGEKVTLLSPPPPERFNPSGLSYYQVIEEPIIKGLFGPSAVDKMIIAHPTVKESEENLYELWPNDEGDKWLQTFGSRRLQTHWRHTGLKMEKLKSRMLKSVPEAAAKAQQEAAKKLKDKKEAEAKVKEKTEAKAQQEAAKKLKGKNKAEAKAQQEAAKKVKDKKKAEAKAQQEAAKKLKDKNKAEAKAQQEAAKKLKEKKKAEAKAQQEAAKKVKDKKKAEAKVKKKAKAKAQQEATNSF